MIGEIAGQVGGVSVRLHEHAIAVVSEPRGPEPHRSVLFVDQALAGEQFDRLANAPRSPRPTPGCTTRRRPSPSGRAWSGCCRGSAPPPIARPPRLPRAPRTPRRALRRTRPGTPPQGRRRRGGGQETLPEGADLSTGVVDVVLAVHPPPAARHDASHGIAVRTPPSVADVERTGGVRRDELDLDLLAGPDLASCVSRLALAHDLGQCVVQPPGRQVEVHEPGTGHLHRSRGAEAGSARSCSANSSASWRGGRPSALALTRAAFVDQSPCSRRAGRSRWTAPASTSMPMDDNARAHGSGDAGASGHGPPRMARREPRAQLPGRLCVVSATPAGRPKESPRGRAWSAAGRAGRSEPPDYSSLGSARPCPALAPVAIPSALVAQRIEHRPPEPVAQVRVLPRAPLRSLSMRATEIRRRYKQGLPSSRSPDGYVPMGEARAGEIPRKSGADPAPLCCPRTYVVHGRQRSPTW